MSIKLWSATSTASSRTYAAASTPTVAGHRPTQKMDSSAWLAAALADKVATRQDEGQVTRECVMMLIE
ncbi:unnamed protein product [Soboliphyme baturini]|uniref:Transposase n=1 Tax=Soboliphyme baturini TaxID=241478 RepID=A0A183JAQ4_9BILA|nr:unnamed protein product [Soboliphyme baturini]